MQRKHLLPLQLFIATALLGAALTAAAQVSIPQTIEARPVKRDAQVLALRGLQLADEGRHAEAVEAYHSALRLAPNDASIYNNLGNSYAQLKRYQEAIAALKCAASLRPDFAIAHYNLGEVYGITGHDVEALAEYSRALALDPKYNKARVKICQTDLALGRGEDAVVCYEMLQKLTTPDALTRSSYGYALNMTKRYKSAIAILEETVRIFPDCVGAYINLAAGLFYTKQHGQAILALQRALELDPQNDGARYSLGVVYLATQNKSAALEQYAILKRTDGERARQLYELMSAKHILSVKRN